MSCPYCGESVNHGATVCKTCHRDIALALSLQEANHALEERVHELEAELAGLRERTSAEPAPAAPEPPPPPRLGIADILAVYLALPTVVLIGVHYLLVIRFDTNLVWLRAASIGLPAVFGWVLQRRAHTHWYLSLTLGVVVGILSVFGMSTMVHFTDGDPILPHSAVDWRETLEYATSIALAYLLGALIARALRPLAAKGTRATGRIAGLARFITLHLTGKKKNKPLEEQVQQMIKLINLAVSAATAIGAVYTGFKSIL